MAADKGDKQCCGFTSPGIQGSRRLLTQAGGDPFGELIRNSSWSSPFDGSPWRQKHTLTADGLVSKRRSETCLTISIRRV
jgi:hypothetical protein